MQLPEQFLTRITSQLGGEVDAFLTALDAPSPVSVRLNPYKPSDRFQNDIPVLWSTFGRFLDQRPVFTLDPLFHAGAYYVQEASSMYLEQMVKKFTFDRQPKLALDLCAAPGGKSTHLRSLLPESALLVCNEIIPQRNRVLCDNIIKWGHPGVVVTRNDPADFNSLPGFFDLILVDAPCSGEGMFRKDEVAIKEWSPENVKHCSVRQKDILSAAFTALAPGGLLIYSTCTWSEQEDEDIVDNLVKSYGMEALSLPEFEGLVMNASSARFYPHRIKGEGFFIAALRKPVDLADDVSSSRKKERKPEAHQNLKKNMQLLDGDFQYRQIGNDWWAIPALHQQVWQLLANNLRVVYAGCKIGTVKGDELIPDHAAALSINLSSHHQRLAVDTSTALRYLRGDAIEIGPAYTGWLVLEHDGLALGWGKAVKGRINNHYPKELRIRMNINQVKD